MGSMLYLASGLENVPKSPENGCFLLKATVFHGPSGKAQTDSFRPFSVLSAPMSPAFRTSCLHRFQVLRAGLWSDMWSTFAFQPNAALLASTSQEAFSFSTGIVPPLTCLCNWSAEPMSTRFGTLETKNTDFSFVLHSRGSNIDSSPNFGCIRKKMCPMPTVNFVGQIHTFQGHIQNVFI